MNSTDNRRIAKNTIILYFRMLFLMAISIYTSRVILNALGVEDYGIYNVVGSFVALFSVLTRTFTSSISRFINYERGKGDDVRLSQLFRTALFVVFILILVIAIVAGLISYWYLTNYMVLPRQRLFAAKIVLLISIASFCISLLNAPFSADIISHENMKIFSYVGIFEGIANLLICFIVIESGSDHLILYSLLILLVQITVLAINITYCIRKYPEASLRIKLHPDIFKDIIGFTSWNVIGSGAFVLREQGLNLIINLFCGPSVNAARGISSQVNRAVSGFSSNFTVSLKPQIIQNYSSNNFERMKQLAYRGAKLSSFLMIIIGCPIIYNINYILKLWLGNNIPDHTDNFIILTLIYTFIESITETVVTSQQATGKIKRFHIVTSLFIVMTLPLAYLAMYMGFQPEATIVVALIISFICVFIRIIICSKTIKLFSLSEFVFKVLLKIFSVCLLCIIAIFLFDKILTAVGWDSFVVKFLSSFLITFLIVYYIGCDSNEKKYLDKFLNKFVSPLKKFFLKTKLL